MKVAVVAHNGKTMGGGLKELRGSLADNGFPEPIWSEVQKSRQAPKRIRAAISAGAELIIAWGGDGMVQRCIDVLAGTDVALAIMPAGTANLLATNLGIPTDVSEAVQIALHGVRHRIDVGKINGEHFAVMAGAGFDGVMINDTSTVAKERVGRLAYIRSSVKAMSAPRANAAIRVNGEPWFTGSASCVLVGNVGTVLGGLKLFEAATPDDGVLDLGVVSAEGPVQWARVLGRVVVHGDVDHSPFVKTTQAVKVDVKFDKKVPWEIDGGARGKTKRLKVRVMPQSVIVCVPSAAAKDDSRLSTRSVSA